MIYIGEISCFQIFNQTTTLLLVISHRLKYRVFKSLIKPQRCNLVLLRFDQYRVFKSLIKPQLLACSVLFKEEYRVFKSLIKPQHGIGLFQ